MVARVKTDKNGRQKASGGCFLTFFWNKAVPKIVLYFFLKTIFYTVNSTSIIVEGKIMKIAMLIIVSLFILHGCTFLRYKINMCLWVCAGVFGCVQVHNVCIVQLHKQPLCVAQVCLKSFRKTNLGNTCYTKKIPSSIKN